MGNQGQASEEDRLVREFILAGAIGPVHEVKILWGGAFWAGPEWDGRPPETPPVPDGLDWDLWLGPAPARPYHPAYHPWRWRDWWDFGTGQIGDMGCHKLSTVFKALKLAHPTSVEAKCDDLNAEIYPRRFEIHYEFPARDGMPPVKLSWYNGGLLPPPPKYLEPGRKMAGDLYIGETGALMGHRIVPESRMQDYGPPPKVLPRSVGHDKEFVDACRGGEPAGSDFVAHSGLLTETALLGNVALRAGKRLEWDGPNCKITNDAEAKALLHRKYREGWKRKAESGERSSSGSQAPAWELKGETSERS